MVRENVFQIDVENKFRFVFVQPTKTIIPFIFVEDYASGIPLAEHESDPGNDLYLKFLRGSCSFNLSSLNGNSEIFNHSCCLKRKALKIISEGPIEVGKTKLHDAALLTELIVGLEPSVLCHGDLNPLTNVLYNIKNASFEVIDFEDSFLACAWFDELFFIYYSGSERWLQLFRVISENFTDHSDVSDILQNCAVWFCVLKLSKVKRRMNGNVIVADLNRRLVIVNDFFYMTEVLRNEI